MLVDKQSNINSQWQVGMLIVTFIICEIIITDINISNFAEQTLKILTIVFSVSVIGIGKCVKYNNGKFVAGKCLGILYIYKIEKEVLAEDIIETKIVQNQEYYFEIQAVTENENLTLAKIPNRINAEKKLEKINSLLKTPANSR